MGGVRIIAFGGGNGLGNVAAALAYQGPEIISDATMVTTAFDDGPTSTGRLGRGSYGDLVRVLGALRQSFFGDRDWMPKRFAERLGRGIVEGQSFGDLLEEVLGGGFGSGDGVLRGEHRDIAINTICAMLNIDHRPKDELWINLFLDALDHPLRKDEFERHPIRNLFLWTLERVAEGQELEPNDALRALHIVYNIPDRYRVIPVSWDTGILRAKTKLGNVIEGQYRIDYPERNPSFRRFDAIEKVEIDRPVSVAKEVLEALHSADVAIISCGSIFGSIAAQFAVENGRLKNELRERHIPIVYVLNLMRRVSEPSSADEIISEIEVAIGNPLSCVIYDKMDRLKGKLAHLTGKPIKLRGLKTYETHPDPELEGPFLFDRKIASIPNENLNRATEDAEQEPIHDPVMLGRALVEVLPEVLAGARI